MLLGKPILLSFKTYLHSRSNISFIFDKQFLFIAMAVPQITNGYSLRDFLPSLPIGGPSFESPQSQPWSPLFCFTDLAKKCDDIEAAFITHSDWLDEIVLSAILASRTSVIRAIERVNSVFHLGSSPVTCNKFDLFCERIEISLQDELE